MAELSKVLLELPVTLCDKHLNEHKESFIVEFCQVSVGFTLLSKFVGRLAF